MKIRVKATARVLSLRAGEIAEIETSPYVDMLVNHGWLVWLDRPADQPIVTPPPAAERKGAPSRGRTTRSVVVLESPGDSFDTTQDFLDALGVGEVHDLDES